MGYLLSCEHVHQFTFRPVRGPVYRADWCWCARVTIRDEDPDPGPDIGRIFESGRRSLPKEVRLLIHAVPAWNRTTLHPFTLYAAQTITSWAESEVHKVANGRAFLLDVSLWEHGQGPRCPVVTVHP